MIVFVGFIGLIGLFVSAHLSPDVLATALFGLFLLVTFQKVEKN